MGVRARTASQVKTWWSEEDFDHTVNQPGHVRTKCPKLEQSRTSDRRRKDEDVCCYNCKECGHYARDCLLPKRTRKEQRSWGVEDEVKRIFWKVMKENNWKPEDFAAKETKEEQSVSSSIDGVHNENMKPGENHLVRNVCCSIEWIICVMRKGMD